MGTGPLTVRQAVETALAAHPSLAAHREQLREFEAQTREAFSGVFPTVKASVTGVRSRNPGLLNSPNFDDFSAGLPLEFLLPVPVTTYDYGISLDQTLYSFGKLTRAVSAAKSKEDQLELEIREQELDLARQVAQACYKLARAQSRIGVLEAERKSREAQVRQAEDFLDIGTGTRLQLLQAKAALASLRSREITARGERTIAAVELNERLGLPVGTEISVDPAVLASAELPDLPPSQELLAAAAVRVDLQALEKDRDVLDKLQKIRNAERLPELRFSGEYGFQAIEIGNLADTNYSNWNAGIYLDWNLYEGGAVKARVEQLDSQRIQSLHRTRERLGEIERDLMSAVTRYRLAREAEEAAAQAVKEAEESLRVSTESRAWGAATALDLLEAERVLTEVRFQELDAVVNALSAEADVSYLVGRLPYEPLE